MYLIISQVYLNYQKSLKVRKNTVCFTNANFNRHVVYKNLNSRKIFVSIIRTHWQFLHFPDISFISPAICTSSQTQIEIFCCGSFLFSLISSLFQQAFVTKRKPARNFLQKAHVTCIKEFSMKFPTYSQVISISGYEIPHVSSVSTISNIRCTIERIINDIKGVSRKWTDARGTRVKRMNDI